MFARNSNGQATRKSTNLELLHTTGHRSNLFSFKLIEELWLLIRVVISPSNGGAVAQSVERATPGEEVPGSIPAVAARSLQIGSVSV